MEVIGFDPALPKDAAAELGIQLMDLADVWAKSDFITLHTPLTPDTKDLVDDDSISQMKDGVIIVNCARGGIINEDALLKALNSGKASRQSQKFHKWFTKNSTKKSLKIIKTRDAGLYFNISNGTRASVQAISLEGMEKSTQRPV